MHIGSDAIGMDSDGLRLNGDEKFDWTALERSDRREQAICSFVGSAMFDRLFQEGMDLVEETAAYLDGPGRNDSKVLPRAAALAYAGESMRLTTRLMQVASWLLVHRSIQEGEITPLEAQRDKYRLGGKDVCSLRVQDATDMMPARLVELLARSERLYDRVSRLDETLHNPPPPGDALAEARNRLFDAFGDRHT